MIKTKKQMYTVIGAFILVMLLTTVTYAFFNYTRIGVANNIRTGRIYFNTSQDGTLNLTNLFPVASNEVGNDYTEDTVKISVTGDTTYTSGIEYLVTAEEVNVETTTSKKVPLTLNVAVTNDLGTEDTDSDQIEYFTDRGDTTSYYKILSESVLYDGQYLLVGYIAPGQTGIDGTINIKAYIDRDKVAISDTYPSSDVSHIESSGEASIEVFDYTNGTTSNWVNGRVVLTTSEWNSLQTTPLSFKVRVEANEGTWIDPATMINSVGNIPSALKENITEIYFIKETPIRMERRYNAATVKADMTDTTLNEGKVLGWQEGNKLYIASSGETYFPYNSESYFSGLSNVTKIEFENVNTSRVLYMSSMFYGCSSLISLDLSNLGGDNIQYMNSTFSNCSNLQYLNMSNFNFGSLTLFPSITALPKLETIILDNAKMLNITSMGSGFASMTNLKSVSLKNAEFNNLTSMDHMFSNSTKLESVDLSGIDTSNVTTMSSLFYGCSKLTNFDFSGINTENVENFAQLFEGCTSIKRIDLSNLDTSSVKRMEWIVNGCTSLEYINLNGLGSDNLTSFTSPFAGSTNLKEIYMSGFNFGKLTSIYGIFPRNYGIKIIDLSNANLGTATDISYLFENLTELETVKLDNINTSDVKYFNGMFSGCSSIQNIDISSFDTSSAIYTSSMFKNCSSLVTIKVSNIFDVSGLASNYAGTMFTGCTSLVGGAGTTYDENHVDNEYAIIDGGPSNPGYLTLKTN